MKRRGIDFVGLSGLDSELKPVSSRVVGRGVMKGLKEVVSRDGLFVL